MHPKQTVVYDGMLFSQKKEWNSDTCYNIDKLWNMMLRERNQIPKVTYIYFFVHSFSSLFFFKYSFICLCQVWYVCGIWFHDQGWNPGLLYWELRVLATGPQGKSLQFIFNFILISETCFWAPALCHQTFNWNCIKLYKKLWRIVIFAIFCFHLQECRMPCCCLVTKSCLAFLQPHGLLPSRLLCPWDFPGKYTGMGCHFLLQGRSHII